LISPQNEDYWGNVNPNGERSMYDEAKRFAEAAVATYSRSYGLKTKIVRIFNTYGPRMQLNDGRVVTNFIVQALRNENITIYGDGKQTRSFSYVEDTVAGIISLMNSTEYDVFNIGNPNEMTVGQLAEKAVWVDEAKCIGCQYCVHVASNTFIVDEFHGRSRAIRQDGDSVDVIQEAIDTCPVDCIHWVKFEELDDLENSLDRDMFQTFGKPPRMNKH